MASRICFIELEGRQWRVTKFKENIRAEKDQKEHSPIIAKGNIFEGIEAKW